MVPVGMAFPGTFGWCVIIIIRLTPVASCFIMVFDEVRTITSVAGSEFIEIVIPTCMNVMTFVA